MAIERGERPQKEISLLNPVSDISDFIPDHIKTFHGHLREEGTPIYEDKRLLVSRVQQDYPDESEQYYVYDKLNELPNYAATYQRNETGLIVDEVETWEFSVVANPDPKERPLITLTNLSVGLEDEEKREPQWERRVRKSILPLKHTDLGHNNIYSDEIFPLDQIGRQLVTDINEQLSRVPGMQHIKKAKMPPKK